MADAEPPQSPPDDPLAIICGGGSFPAPSRMRWRGAAVGR